MKAAANALKAAAKPAKIAKALKKGPKTLQFAMPRLVTFDAFGTLFKLRESVAETYSSIAKSHAGVHVSPETIATKFPGVFADMRRRHPHYGVKTLSEKSDEPVAYTSKSDEPDVYTRKWWTEVIKNTFAPVELPDKTIKYLYDYYSQADAYSCFFDVHPTLEALKKDGVILAVVSDSDSRTHGVIRQLALDKYFSPSHTILEGETGSTKPEPLLFMFMEGALGVKQSAAEQKNKLLCWHVGDNFEKDGGVAKVPGWRSILIDRSLDAATEAAGLTPASAGSKITKIRNLEHLLNLYKRPKAKPVVKPVAKSVKQKAEPRLRSPKINIYEEAPFIIKPRSRLGRWKLKS